MCVVLDAKARKRAATTTATAWHVWDFGFRV